jgi:hypothetical protein
MIYAVFYCLMNAVTQPCTQLGPIYPNPTAFYDSPAACNGEPAR